MSGLGQEKARDQDDRQKLVRDRHLDRLLFGWIESNCSFFAV
jgi:hypothetical protein